jgi:hypothetical protein
MPDKARHEQACNQADYNPTGWPGGTALTAWLPTAEQIENIS